MNLPEARIVALSNLLHCVTRTLNVRIEGGGFFTIWIFFLYGDCIERFELVSCVYDTRNLLVALLEQLNISYKVKMVFKRGRESVEDDSSKEGLVSSYFLFFLRVGSLDAIVAIVIGEGKKHNGAARVKDTRNYGK